MSMNPKIRTLTEELFPYIGKFLKEKGQTIEAGVHAYLEEQQKKNPTKFKYLAFRRVGFTAEGYPWSYQVEFVINNLVRSGRVEETGSKLKLTDYGETLIK